MSSNEQKSGIKQRIVIHNDGVDIIQEQVVKSVSVESFLYNLTKDREIMTPILPEGTVSFTQVGTAQIFFVQRPQVLRTIDFQNRIITIAWPWHVFGVIVENMVPVNVCLYFAKDRITDPRDKLYYTPLPNVYSSNNLCLGSGFKAAFMGSSNPSELLRRVIEYVYNAQMNAHNEQRALGYIPAEFQPIAAEHDIPMTSAGRLFKVWEIWVKDRGTEEWQTINRLSWFEAGPFEAIRRGFRS